MFKGILPINTLSTIAGLGTAISILPAEAVVLLAMATGVGIATAPAQAATITYSCPNGQAQGYCTLQQLFNGGVIRVDENDDNIIDKTFRNWVNSSPPNVPNIRVTASGSPLLGQLTFTSPTGLTTLPNFQHQFLFNVDTSTNTAISITGLELELLNATVTPNVAGAVEVSVTANGAKVSKAVFSTFPPIIVPTSSLVVSNSTNYQVNTTLLGTMLGSGASGTINQFKMDFKQSPTVISIPEPSAVVGLLAFCSLGLGMKRKQRDS